MNTLLPQATQDMIQEYLDSLPEYMQDSLERIDWTAELARIGAKHRLGQEQITNLTVETAMTIFGISEPQLFYNNIINHIGVSREIAESITHDVAERIFERMQEVIRDEYGDQIVMLQDELTRLDKQEAQDTNQQLADVGIKVGDEAYDPVYSGLDMEIPELKPTSLAEKKLNQSFSLDAHDSTPVHYPESDPYHEAFDVMSEDIHPVMAPAPAPAPAPPKREDSVPSMILPPLPPSPPKR